MRAQARRSSSSACFKDAACGFRARRRSNEEQAETHILPCPAHLRLGDRPRRNVSRRVVGPLNEAEQRLSSSSDIKGLASKAQLSNREALRFARSLSLFDQGCDRLVIPKMRERKSTAVSFKRGLNLFLLKRRKNTKR